MEMFLYILTYLVFNTLGLTFLKLSTIGMKLELVSDYFSLLFKPQFIFGFALYAASFLTWILILSKKDISYAYPIVMGLGYVTVMVTAAIFFKDSFSFNKILGAIFVGLGVVIISF